MKLVVFNEKEIESFKKSGVIKYAMLALATPIGLILSCVLAYINIDFMELLKIFSENISNPEILDELTQIMSKWYIISGVIFFASLLLFVIYFVRNRKNDEDVLTWGQTIFLAIELILISQHLEDDDMIELSLRVIVRLNDLTDQEFAEMEFVAAE